MTEASLHERVAALEEQIAKLSVKERAVPDMVAKELILVLLDQKKQQGIRQLDAIDIKRELHLPFAQISMIMQSLEEQGIVHGKI
jgi:hypothetical protein